MSLSTASVRARIASVVFFASLTALALSFAASILFGGDAPEAELEPAQAAIDRAFSQEDLVAGWIAVDFADGVDKARYDEIEKSWGIDVEFNSAASVNTALTIGRVPVDTPEALDALLDKIRAHPEVEHAEPLFRYAASFVPDDPLFEKQWNFEMIGLTRAWDVSRGEGVTVAVIDTGVAYEDRDEFRAVPDLRGARFAPGYDFVNDDAHANDDHGHGTHVAGTIAQRTDNGEGVAGVAFEATLMPLKVLDMNGMGNSADIAEAIRWAADHGARVLNLSLGGGGYSKIMADAVAYAADKGALVVCAAGNGGRAKVEYPAAYPGALAVSAIGPSGRLASYSSYGPQVAISAPGGDIRASGVAEHGILQNTIRREAVGQSHYAFYQGTSMATPHVAGVAALLFAAGAPDADAVRQALFQGAKKPRSGIFDASPRVAQVKSTANASADDTSATEIGASGALASGRSIRHGHGVLDAIGALKALGIPVDRSPGVRFAALVLALALLFLARLTLPSDKRRARTVGLTIVFGAAIASLGLFFMPWIGCPSRLAMPMVRWPLPLIGGAGMNAVFGSALIPFVLGFFTHAGRCRLGRELAIGLSLGFAGALLVEAFSGATIALLPFATPGSGWFAATISAVWFVANACLSFLLARALMGVPEGGRR